MSLVSKCSQPCLALEFPVPLSLIPSLLCQMEFPLILHTGCTFSSFLTERCLPWSGLSISRCGPPSSFPITVLQYLDISFPPKLSLSVPFVFPKLSESGGPPGCLENPQISPTVSCIIQYLSGSWRRPLSIFSTQPFGSGHTDYKMFVIHLSVNRCFSAPSSLPLRVASQLLFVALTLPGCTTLKEPVNHSEQLFPSLRGQGSTEIAMLILCQTL